MMKSIKIVKRGNFNIIKDFWVVLYVFLYVFNCPVANINIRTALDLVNVAVLFVSMSKDKIIKLNRPLAKLLLGFVPFLTYTLIMGVYHVLSISTITSDQYFSDFRVSFLVFVRIILFVAVFAKICEYKKYTRDDVFKIMISVGLVQLFFVLFAFFVPKARTYFVTNMLARYKTERATRVSKMTQRSYGFSENLFDAFGYIVSLITAYTLVRFMNTKNVVNALIFILMFIPPILNTRTGLVFNFIIIVVVFLYHIRQIFSGKLIKILVILALSVLFLRTIYGMLPQTTQKWIYRGAVSVFKFIFEKEEEGVFSALKKDIIYPDNMLFGLGTSPQTVGIMGIDLGYIQCLWRFGIAGTVLLLFAFARMFVIGFLAAGRKKYRDYQCIILISGILFFVYLVKLYSINNIGSYAVYIPIIVFSIMPAKDELKNAGMADLFAYARKDDIDGILGEIGSGEDEHDEEYDEQYEEYNEQYEEYNEHDEEYDEE